ncbi:MAG: ribonuclease Y [Candidatus Brocadiaceae bacterium]|nr:ribonuclease Y [Candidatus Brocadiaceae bacterium]
MTSNPLIYFPILPVCIVFGFLICFLFFRLRQVNREKTSKNAIKEAKLEAERIVKNADISAREELFKKKEDYEKETQETRQELRHLEKRLSKREDSIERKIDIMTKKEKYIESMASNLSNKERELNKKNIQLDEIIKEEKDTLYKISTLSVEAAEKLLLSRLEKELEVECAGLIEKHIKKAKEEAEKNAISIVGTAIQRCTANSTVDNVVSSIELPGDEMKGRIIGREGRNIRAFEKATGIDVIVDDTPGIIVLSGFDGVRREIARLAMKKLIIDGRIHPARIEEVVQETEKDIEQIILETGKQTSFELGIHDLHTEIIKLIGRLRYRTSYGQNQLQHSIEVSNLAGVLAGELKLDPQLARRCGLLHDIGKAVSAEVEGTHALVGADIAKRYEEKHEVVNAIASHHEEVPSETVYSVLINAADAISASRPGARRETLEKYVKRLEKLESVAMSFSGVESAFAIQAGREVRVIVHPDKVSDKSASKICYDIAKNVEDELEYPGEVTVTVIREKRVVQKAK